MTSIIVVVFLTRLIGAAAEERKGSESISGRILDREKRGIGGATVLAYREVGWPGESLLDRLELLQISEIAQKPPCETVSLGDGSYRIDGLDDASYTIKAVRVGYSPEEKEGVIPSLVSVDLALSEGSVVAGVVVDSSTGFPIPVAKILAFPHAESADLFAVIHVRSRPPLATITSGADGRFKFEVLGTGPNNFVVAAKGYQEGSALKVDLQVGENKPLHLSLERGLVMAGKVVSQSGKPITGASVRVTPVDDKKKFNPTIISVDDRSVKTDDRGSFSFDTLGPGEHQLLAWHSHYASNELRGVEAGAAPLTVILSSGAFIAGRVIESGTGKPIPNASITCSDRQTLKKVVFSDGSGAFTAQGVTSTNLSLTIEASGFVRRAGIPVNVAPEGEVKDLRFELEQAVTVSGLVLDQQGAPMAHARVMGKKMSLSNHSVTQVTAVTERNGRFQLRGVDGGQESWVTVKAPGYLETKTRSFAAIPGETIELSEIRLRLGGSIQGTVEGPDGKPLRRVHVLLRREGSTEPDPALRAASDDKGQFVVAGLAAGTVDLIIQSDDHIEETVTGLKVEEGVVIRDVRVTLRKKLRRRPNRPTDRKLTFGARRWPGLGCLSKTRSPQDISAL